MKPLKQELKYITLGHLTNQLNAKAKYVFLEPRRELNCLRQLTLKLSEALHDAD